LGVGDVGPVVLSDRLALAKSGIVVLVIPKVKGELDLDNITVISRGFVFMKQADEVVDFIQQKAKAVIQSVGKDASHGDIRKKIERSLGRKLYQVLQREPMIVPVIMDM
jgi:ribonuclease J